MFNFAKQKDDADIDESSIWEDDEEEEEEEWIEEDKDEQNKSKLSIMNDDKDSKSSLVALIYEYTRLLIDKDNLRADLNSGTYSDLSLSKIAQKISEIYTKLKTARENLSSTLKSFKIENTQMFLSKIDSLVQESLQELSDYKGYQQERLDWMAREGYILLYYMKSFIYSLTIVMPYYKWYLQEEFKKSVNSH